MLTSNQKGAIAEAAVTHAASKLGIGVLRPVMDERYDLVLDLRPQLVRVQCKWVCRLGGVINVRCYSSRRCREGFVKLSYTSDEVDAIAAHCSELDRCFFLPMRLFEARRNVQLRLAPAMNNQRAGVNWAADYDLESLDLHALRGAIAQLGERLHGMQEVAGSSPAGSTPAQ